MLKKQKPNSLVLSFRKIKQKIVHLAAYCRNTSDVNYNMKLKILTKVSMRHKKIQSYLKGI